MKEQPNISSFMADVGPEFEPLVAELHELMTGAGFGLKIQEAKSGHVVSYLDPKTKKTALNLVSRRKGPVARLYADNIHTYEALLAALPASMKQEFEKAGPCKRLAGTSPCNSRCPMGYTLQYGGQEVHKCRYNIMFAVTTESLPHLRAMLEKEAALRSA